MTAEEWKKSRLCSDCREKNRNRGVKRTKIDGEIIVGEIRCSVSDPDEGRLADDSSGNVPPADDEPAAKDSSGNVPPADDEPAAKDSSGNVPPAVAAVNVQNKKQKKIKKSSISKPAAEAVPETVANIPSAIDIENLKAQFTAFVKDLSSPELTAANYTAPETQIVLSDSMNKLDIDSGINKDVPGEGTGISAPAVAPANESTKTIPKFALLTPTESIKFERGTCLCNIVYCCICNLNIVQATTMILLITKFVLDSRLFVIMNLFLVFRTNS